MTEVTRDPPGTPSWLTLNSPDARVSEAFYGGLFGWDSYTIAFDRFGDYVVWTLGGPQTPAVCCGLQALADDTERPSWTCLFFFTSLRTAMARMRAAGGHALSDEIDLGPLGPSALVTDPEGTDLGFSQPHTRLGTAWTGEPATMYWVELACRDIDRAKRFYGEALGWTFTDRSCHGTAYTEAKAAGRPVAGMVAMDERWPPHYLSHWMPYFAVADCDESAARAAELGGKIRLPPTDIAPGRFALMTDPTGARLAVIQPARRLTTAADRR